MKELNHDSYFPSSSFCVNYQTKDAPCSCNIIPVCSSHISLPAPLHCPLWGDPFKQTMKIQRTNQLIYPLLSLRMAHTPPFDHQWGFSRLCLTVSALLSAGDCWYSASQWVTNKHLHSGSPGMKTCFVNQKVSLRKAVRMPKGCLYHLCDSRAVFP